jgi:regulator of replication initiation timing
MPPFSFKNSYKTSQQAEAAAQPPVKPQAQGSVQEAITETRQAFQTAEEKAAKTEQKKISDLKKSFNGMIEENKDGEVSDAELLSSLKNMRTQLATYHGGRRKTRRRKTHRRR